MGRADAGMKLAAFLYPTGYHVAAWRHPDVPADAGVNFAHFAELARTAERGLFDFLFLADSAAVRGTDLPALSRTAIRYVAQFEPLTLLSALAVVTERIGLVASATSTYNEPYHLARKFASLDFISGGRAGWNLVTSSNGDEAHNFGLDAHPAHGERYERAREFAGVVKGLWDSWEDDAFLRDKDRGLYFDPEKLHVLHHQGEEFSVRGPLNVPRTPQGHPVLVQSGSSDVGRELAAEIGEVVFTAQPTLAGAKAFSADVKARAAKRGRSPEDMKVMPGIFPFVGRTQAEAEARYEQLQSLIDPVVGLSLLNGLLPGVDLAAHPLDGPLPEVPQVHGSWSRQNLIVEEARRKQLTIRQLYLDIAGSRGHWQLVGTPERIADEMEAWFRAGAADGFNVMAPYLPGGLDAFVALVIPELQRRGLFRTRYEGRTLREHLGLRRPEHVSRRASGPSAVAG
ncbi:LLM class flavin-dependent oxidoreductase [Myxococcus sp. K15C18031901]|uniref:LLM class flavin-dependent oxidoreductase n=1 Tax=Myxococcus dinghuensis TaxID=2906761 RepID=UPI0020A700E9|nr:LLM class flavin-dependent oxidoreductase [Myxococcus dinghuensis]MCP3102423.1 LLM class flavin-dependent oxidoreductase [Myxococcus dinghuensis]